MLRLSWAVVGFLLIAATTHAASADQLPNGCGPEGYGWAVPDGTIFCSFDVACNKHDICYSRCDEGGDLFGNPICKDEAARKERRSICDSQFYQDIVDNNANVPHCSFYASLYKLAVELGGDGNFNGLVVSDRFASRYGSSDTVLTELQRQIEGIGTLDFGQKSTLIELDVDAAGQPIVRFSDPETAKEIAQSKGIFNEIRYGDILVENPVSEGAPLGLEDILKEAPKLDLELLSQSKSFAE